MVRVLHAYDWHLDSAYGALSPEQARQRRAESRALVRELVDYANDHGVQLLLLPGDLLDSDAVYAQTAEELSAALSAFRGAVFIAPGNHDYYTSGSPYATTLWPENVHEVLGIRFPPLTWCINRVVDKIYKGSDTILCASRGFVENLKQKGVPEEKLVFWPQFCLDPRSESLRKPEIYSEDTFNVTFAGNLGDAQGLDLLIEAARELKGQGIRWHLVGDGRARQRLENLVREYGLEEDVIFTGRVSESEANGYVAYADCAYLSFRNNPLFDMTLPAKLQTYLACGVPVLAAAGGESAAIINRAGCGIAVEAKLESLVSAAREMAAKTPEERLTMAQAARRYYEENFTMQDLVDRLEEMLPSC